MSEYVTAAYPAKGHRFVNTAKAAGAVSTATMCSRAHVFGDEPPDVLFVEFSCMSGFGGNAVRDKHSGMNGDQRNIERFLRKFLQRGSAEHPTAIILLNTFNWCRDHRGCKDDGEVFYANNYSTLDTTWLRNNDDNFDAVMRYYGQPSVSTRDAYFHHHARQEPGFLLYDFIVNGDQGVHHNDLGHTYVADIVVTLLEAADALAPPAGRGGYKALAAEAEAAPIPPPLHRGNYAGLTMTCHVFNSDEGVKMAVQRNEGWVFTAHEPGTGGAKKTGLETSTPGSWFEVVVDTVPLEKASKHSTGEEGTEEYISVTYISSFEGFGTVKIECLSGCTCEDLTLSAHNKERGEGSPIKTKRIRASQSRRCHVRVTLLEETDSGGHKFKIQEVRTSYNPVRGWQGKAPKNRR